MVAFFNKVLATIGVGSAKVDTKLEQASYAAGDWIKGVVEVRGGNVEQAIDSIYVSVMTTYERETDDRKTTEEAAVVKEKLNEPFTIGAGEVREFPLEMQLPYETPATQGKTRVWIATGLDIKQALNPSDKDLIQVKPSLLAKSVLDAAAGLGFHLRQVECKAARLNQYPFAQEFEFVPVSGVFKGQLDELEITFIEQTENEVTVLLQVDRRARGLGGFLSEAMGTDESLIRLRLAKKDLPSIPAKLKETISRFA